MKDSIRKRFSFLQSIRLARMKLNNNLKVLERIKDCDSKADMLNFMSLPSVGCVNFQGLGKLLALNICCFVIKLLFVTILRSFQCNFVGRVRLYCDFWGKTGGKGCHFR